MAKTKKKAFLRPYTEVRVELAFSDETKWTKMLLLSPKGIAVLVDHLSEASQK